MNVLHGERQRVHPWLIENGEHGLQTVLQLYSLQQKLPQCQTLK